MKIKGLCSYWEGGGYYRIRLPLDELARHGHSTVCAMARSDQQADGADIITGHMIGSPDPDQAITMHRWWRRLARTCRRVYEVDDDPFELEAHNPVFTIYNHPVARDNIMHCMQTADLITASTPVLAERMSAINSNVAVCRNRIDESLLDVERPRRDRLVIGWAGGASHSADITEAVYGVRRTLDRNPDTELHLIGMDYSDLIGRSARFTPWHRVTTDYYRLIDFDIGIAPLRSTVFAETKSHIKALEYAALGIPVVASDTAAYRDFVVDGVTGWLVRREHEWAARLRELINDEAMRDEMGAKAKQVAADWTIQKGWREWETAYSGLL